MFSSDVLKLLVVSTSTSAPEYVISGGYQFVSWGPENVIGIFVSVIGIGGMCI